MSEQEQRIQRETRRKKIRQQKRRRLVVLALAVVIVVLLIIGIVKLVGWLSKPKHGESANIGPTPPAAEEPVSVTTPPKFYDYTQPVPENEEPAPDSTFSSSVLMIGDSRVEGFSLYGVMSSVDILSGNSLTVESILNYEFEVDGGSIKLVDRLAEKRYDAIYIMIGLNEMSWMGAESYYVNYAALVDTIKTLAPSSAVYLQSAIPISNALSTTSSSLSNQTVAEYNARLVKLGEEKQVYYLDLTEALSATTVLPSLPGNTDDTGDEDTPDGGTDGGAPTGGYPALSSQYAESNGYSLTKSAYTAWYEYLKMHVVDRSIYSN